MRVIYVSATLALVLGIMFAPVSVTAQQIPEHPTLRYFGFSPIKEPSQRPALRKAFCYALDRDTITKAVAPSLQRALRGQVPKFLQPATTLEVPQLPTYSPSVKGCGYDPEKARQFWKEADWSGNVIIFIRRDPPEFLTVLFAAAKANLEQVLPGLTVTEQRIPLDSMRRQEIGGNIPIVLNAQIFRQREQWYPSFSKDLAAGIADLVPRIKELMAGDNAALEQHLLDESWFVPIIRHDRFQ